MHTTAMGQLGQRLWQRFRPPSRQPLPAGTDGAPGFVAAGDCPADTWGSTADEAPATRADTLVTCLIVLMDAYRCNTCPRLALCIARHFQCLAEHPDTDAGLRSLSLRLQQEWEHLSGPSLRPV